MLDLRLAINDDVTEECIKIRCVAVGHNDSVASMAVYSDHIHCYGCGFHAVGPAALGHLLGHSITPADTLRYSSDTPERYRVRVETGDISPLSAAHAELYHRFLYQVLPHRLTWLYARGLTDSIIQRFQIGHTGEHFTIPVFTEDRSLISFRYRADPDIADSDTLRKRKYTGMKGRNGLYPYPVWVPLDKSAVFLTEGELDTLYLRSIGLCSYTMTNGAGRQEQIFTMFPAIRQASSFVIATDMDASGNEAARRIAEEAEKYKLRVGRLVWEGQYKDVSEWQKQTPWKIVRV